MLSMMMMTMPMVQVSAHEVQHLSSDKPQARSTVHVLIVVVVVVVEHFQGHH